MPRMPRRGCAYGTCSRLAVEGSQYCEEHKKLMDLCQRTGLGTTRLLRKLVTDTELKAKPTPELREVLRAVDRIGNNLNQLAHRANAVGLIDRAEWDRVKALHRELREQVERWR